MRSLLHLTTFLSLLASAADLPKDGSNVISSEWSGWGANIFNNHWVPQNRFVSSDTIAALGTSDGSNLIHCVLNYPEGFSAAPAIHEEIAYFPTWNGSFIALRLIDCSVLWTLDVSQTIQEYSPVSDERQKFLVIASRTSPQVSDGVVYLGTLANALAIAVDSESGRVLDVVQLSPHPFAIVTMSPTVYNGILFIGTSSVEESAATSTNYTCCTFIGTMYALAFERERSKFSIQWRVNMIADARAVEGWAGAAIWGSQPSVDPSRGQVFIATGNTYHKPAALESCESPSTNSTSVNLNGTVCLPADVWQEAVLALDISTGRPSWVRQLSPLDAWTVACGAPSFGIPISNAANCPSNPGQDADFGMAPTFVPGNTNTPQEKDILVIGQKNGILHALYAEDGTEAWAVATSPDSEVGGLSWGVAADDARVYYTAIAGMRKDWTLRPSGQTINNSAWGAASLKDGSFLWQTQVTHGNIAYTPPTVVNDIVLTGRTGLFDTPVNSTRGGVVALNKATGKVLLDFELDGPFRGGVAVQNDYVAIGTGYSPGSGFTGRGSFIVAKLST